MIVELRRQPNEPCVTHGRTMRRYLARCAPRCGACRRCCICVPFSENRQKIQKTSIQRQSLTEKAVEKNWRCRARAFAFRPFPKKRKIRDVRPFQVHTSSEAFRHRDPPLQSEQSSSSSRPASACSRVSKILLAIRLRRSREFQKPRSPER